MKTVLKQALVVWTSALCLMTQAAWAESSTRSLADIVRSPEDIRAYEILGRSDVRERAQRLTGPDFARVARSVSVAVPTVVVDGRFLVGRGCQPHSCSTAKTTIAVDARSGKVYVTTTDDDGTLIAPARSSWPVQVLALAKEWDPRVAQSNEALPATSAKTTSPSDVVDLASIDQRIVWNHGGSEVAIDHGRGLIVYVIPKPSLHGVVRPGQVLFRGTIPEDGKPVAGTAFLFRNGCQPAPYRVVGTFSAEANRPTLVLRGSAPRRARSGCDVLGMDDQGPNSRLKFTFLLSP